MLQLLTINYFRKRLHHSQKPVIKWITNHSTLLLNLNCFNKILISAAIYLAWITRTVWLSNFTIVLTFTPKLLDLQLFCFKNQSAGGIMFDHLLPSTIKWTHIKWLKKTKTKQSNNNNKNKNRKNKWWRKIMTQINIVDFP